ncbi:MAG: hypothetical protein R2761_18715 [Acidimicrobiales bacterium]
MTVTRHAERPAGHRCVPLLHEPDLGHYPEFAAFLADTFDLRTDPFRAPAVVAVDGRLYELTFTGRSGRPFPAGLEVGAIVEGLEPLDADQADRDLLELMGWLADGAGPPWSAQGVRDTAAIFKVAAARARP